MDVLGVPLVVAESQELLALLGPARRAAARATLLLVVGDDARVALPGGVAGGLCFVSLEDVAVTATPDVSGAVAWSACYSVGRLVACVCGMRRVVV